MITLGKYRHLAQCSTPNGHFTILAIDHRNNLLKSLNQHAPAPLTPSQFTAFKQLVMRHLLPLVSAVLTDPEHGFGVGIAENVIGGQVGLISPLEVTNYEVHPSQTTTELMDGWSVAKIKRVGAQGVKMLLYFHPQAENAQAKLDLVARVVEECARYDIPFFLEPIAFSLDPARKLESSELRRVVVETAHLLSRSGADILKVEFPINVAQEPDEEVWKAALAELNDACQVPWALLSGGVSYETFRHQAELACQAGASGVMVGRAVWAEAVTLQGAEREQFLQTTARQRLAELGAICAAHGVNWRERSGQPQVAEGWYKAYPA